MATEQISGPGDRWDASHSAFSRSPTLRSIWREVYGDDYPDDVSPHSFVTLSDLNRVASALRTSQGASIVDIGCGSGGPGLWVARELRATLIGLDISPVGVQQAIVHAAQLGMTGQAHFRVAGAASTGLPAASLDGAMSIDVLLFVPDLPATLREISRILRPSARLVFTTWEFHGSLSSLTDAPPVKDYRPLLQDAKFEVDAYEEAPDWERRQREIFRRIEEAEPFLRDEVGQDESRRLVQWARTRSAELHASRRVFCVATRP